MDRKHFRHQEAADYLGISPKTLSNYAANNLIPRQKPTRGLVFYLIEDLDEFIRRNRIESNSEPLITKK